MPKGRGLKNVTAAALRQSKRHGESRASQRGQGSNPTTDGGQILVRQHEEIDFDLIFRRKDGIHAPSDALAATVPPLPCQKRLGQVQAWHD